MPRWSKKTEYLLKALGLLAVAIVSGFLWWLIRNNPAQPTAQATERDGFSLVQGPVSDTNCPAHATYKVQKFLISQPCVRLTRSLYLKTMPDGNQVIASVVVIQMKDATAATNLNTLASANNTGNVNTLVDDGATVPGGVTALYDGAYQSEQHGDDVIIAMTKFTNTAKDTHNVAHNTVLKGVSQDALQLGVTS